MLKLIILDLDDTIINYSHAHTIAFEKMIYTLSKICKLSTDHINNMYKQLKTQLYQQYDNQFIRHDKLLQIKLLCNKLKINNINKIFTIYNAYENDYLSNLYVFENCIQFLNICKELNITTCIMSNNLLHVQLKVCNKFKLHNYVDALFTSNEFYYEKPHEECLKYILNYYDVQNHEVMIIGDSVTNDIEWGKNNNIKTILCDNNSEQNSFANCIKIIQKYADV